MLRLIVRLRNLVEKISYEVLELCCFEWFQNSLLIHPMSKEGFNQRRFRAVLFRMVPKLFKLVYVYHLRFRAVLFRMVPKQKITSVDRLCCFRAVLFRMVPKQNYLSPVSILSFRAVLFRMVPKLLLSQFSVDIS